MERKHNGMPRPTYAVLGSTGNCGQAIIRLLLEKEDVKVNAYCRNKAKLVSLLPEVLSDKRVEIFQGSIEDVDLMANCARGCKTIFLVASTNDNIPGCHITQDLVRSVIAAFRNLKAETPSPATLPQVCLLSSSTIDDHLSRHMGFFKHIMSRAASHVYEDLRQGERMLREQEDWIRSVYMKPGGLSLDVKRGHELSVDEDETFVSYLDLAAGMIEVADASDGRWDAKNVSVRNAKGMGTATFPRGTPACIFFGLVRHFLPMLHPYLPTTGPA